MGERPVFYDNRLTLHPGPVPDARVRVLSLNLWHDPDARESRLRAAALLIERYQPHVVALQESVGTAGVSAAEQLASLTGLHVAGQSPRERHAHGAEMSGTAVLTSLTQHGPEDAYVLPGSAGSGGKASAVTVSLRTPANRSMQVTSAHLAVGGARDAMRLEQVAYLDDHLAATDTAAGDGIRVLAGDLNTTPDTDTHRFLTGRGTQQGRSTYWLDAWEVAGSGTGVTSSSANPWAAVTAQRHGIAAHMLPDRRIDYVLVHEWRWGRPGMPLIAKVAGAPYFIDGEWVHPSDHYAVVVDLWDPPLS